MAKYSHESIQKAIVAARAVDRSHAGHHAALMGLVAVVAKADNPLSLLTEYARNRVQESPDSLCTLATFAWLKRHFGLRVDEKSGEVKRGRDFTKKGFTDATFEAARAMPWDKLAKEMAFKVPEKLSLAAAAATAAKMEYAGTDIPTMEELYKEFVASVTAYKKNAKFKEWQGQYHKHEQEEWIETNTDKELIEELRNVA